MDDRWKSELMSLIGYAISTLECLSYQVNDEVKEKIMTACNYLKSESDKINDAGK